MRSSNSRAGLIILMLVLFLSVFVYKNVLGSTKQDEKPMTLAEYNKRTANKDKLVLTYFWADWCSVCAKMKPLLEKFEKDYATQVEVIRVDTERDVEVTQEFEVNALPILILYKSGTRKWIHVGLMNDKELRATVNSYLPVTKDP